MAVAQKTSVRFDFPDLGRLSAAQMESVSIALTDASIDIVQAAKSNLSSGGNVRTGALLQAISYKVKYSKKGYVYAIIGIDNKVKSTDKNGKPIKPSKYAHFIELGTSELPAKHFLEHAFNGKKSVIEAELQQAASRVL